MKNALIVVDLQNDFLSAGALSVSNGDEVIPVIDRLLKLPFDFKIATQDWHSKGHVSFASTHGKKPREEIEINHVNQILWPDHCIQGTFGAEFAKGIDWSVIDRIVHKGTEKNVDSYSAFFDNEHLRSTGLLDYLKSCQVTEIFIAGLSTDYCVKYSALDAIKAGFITHVIVDACRAVNIENSDEELAIEEMRMVNVIINNSKQIEESFNKT